MYTAAAKLQGKWQCDGHFRELPLSRVPLPWTTRWLSYRRWRQGSPPASGLKIKICQVKLSEWKILPYLFFTLKSPNTWLGSFSTGIISFIFWKKKPKRNTDLSQILQELLVTWNLERPFLSLWQQKSRIGNLKSVCLEAADLEDFSKKKFLTSRISTSLEFTSWKRSWSPL